MADVHSAERRRKNMQAIRHKNTWPEILIRQLLHQRGFRFRLHVKTLPGAPDIVLPKYSAAIFINGCFWHGHSCYLFRLPQTRQAFWETKINANRTRDIKSKTALHDAGWRVLIVWECAIKGRLRQPQDALMDEISDWLRADQNAKGFYHREMRCMDNR